MTSTGVAPAPATSPSRTIVGPFLTSAGFQYWYLACLPDCVVAVPQGMWTGMMLALSNSVPPIFGLLGALLVHLGSRRGQKLRVQIEATLQSTPDSQLRMNPNTVFPIAELRSIAFKGGKFAHAPAGSLITPDII